MSWTLWYMIQDTTYYSKCVCLVYVIMFIQFNLYKMVTTYKWKRNVIKDAEPMSHTVLQSIYYYTIFFEYIIVYIYTTHIHIFLFPFFFDVVSWHRKYKLVSIKKMEALVKVSLHINWLGGITHHKTMKLRIFSYIFRARFSFWVYSLENMANLSLLNNNMIFKGVIMSEFITWFWFSFLFVWGNIFFFFGCAFKMYMFIFAKEYLLYVVYIYRERYL